MFPPSVDVLTHFREFHDFRLILVAELRLEAVGRRLKAIRFQAFAFGERFCAEVAEAI